MGNKTFQKEFSDFKGYAKEAKEIASDFGIKLPKTGIKSFEELS